MARIVGVHGIAQEYKGEATLKAEWLPGLLDGLHRNDIELDPSDFECAYYGHTFRERHKAGAAPPYTWEDVSPGAEHDLLLALADAAEQGAGGPTERTKARAPGAVQRALHVLARSPFFASVAEPLLIYELKQVTRYLGDPEIRKTVRAHVSKVISSDTRVLIGHSLGSVVAYELLCNPPKHWNVDTFVTVGSPLGIPNLIFHRLDPKPLSTGNGRSIGSWPPTIKCWTNIADEGDLVALDKNLAPLFGGARIADVIVVNGAEAHSIRPYLTAAETGAAVARGLRAE